MSRGGSPYLHEEVGKKRNDDEDNVLLHNGLKNDAGSRQRLSVLIFELLELLGVTGAKRFHSILRSWRLCIVPFAVFLQRNAPRDNTQCPRNGDEQNRRASKSADTDTDLLLNALFIPQSRKQNYTSKPNTTCTDCSVRNGSQEGQHDTADKPSPARNQQQQFASIRNQVCSLE